MRKLLTSDFKSSLFLGFFTLSFATFAQNGTHHERYVAPPSEVAYEQFKSRNEPSTVIIEWATSDEYRNEYFTVLRSEDGFDYIEVGALEGAGTSTSVLYYKLEDLFPITGPSYYRLVRTDDEGVSEILETIEHTRDGNARILEDEVPNSVRKGGSIELSNFNTITGTHLVNVVNSDGHVVHTHRLTRQEMKSNFTLHLPASLEVGVYELQFFDTNNLQSYSEEISVY